MNAQQDGHAHLRDRKITHWQHEFAKYIYQETGYVPDLESVKLAMLLQKAYRVSPWNQSRLKNSEAPEPLPDLPLEIERIDAHPPAGAAHIRTSFEWAELKADLGPLWEYRRKEPFDTVFTPEPEPDPEVIDRAQRRIAAARTKAGRKATK